MPPPGEYAHRDRHEIATLSRGARQSLWIIEPREFLVEIHAKSRNWQALIVKKPDDPLAMPEFGLRCLVVDLYRRTPLDPHRGN